MNTNYGIMNNYQMGFRGPKKTMATTVRRGINEAMGAKNGAFADNMTVSQLEMLAKSGRLENMGKNGKQLLIIF